MALAGGHCRLWLVGALTLAVAAGCERGGEPPPEQRVVGGDPEIGRNLVASYGCGSCHVVPGVRSAGGTVGPPLTDFGRRAYVAGQFPNRPDNLTRWLRNPPAMIPQTAMPNMGVSETEARHIAAYLYTLR